MSDELMAKIRGRVEQCRRLAKMINDPQAAKVLHQMADDAEADLRKLQAEAASQHNQVLKMPPPIHG
jgi:hypothetical protein